MDISGSSKGSFLGRLGFGGSRKDSASGSNPVLQVRRHLLDEISSFLLTHNLEVSSSNLVIAHDAFSGANSGLARKLTARMASGQPITQQWLDEVTATSSDKGGQEGIQVLMMKLEATLEAFSTNTDAARSATSEYNRELEQHVADLEHIHGTGDIISSLAGLAKAMLERTRTVEEEMRRSEEEARSLRKSLAKAKRDADVDHLTGLPNRRAFETILDNHYREARETSDTLCVAFCDIDHFKQVNDTHGHDAGDRVIKAIANALADISDDNCHVARHGGEEFVMLFRGSPLDEAHERLDRLREQLAARRLINRKTDKPFGQVTFSGGVASVFDYPNPRDALKAADEALYRAKENGRNQIQIARP